MVDVKYCPHLSTSSPLSMSNGLSSSNRFAPLVTYDGDDEDQNSSQDATVQVQNASTASQQPLVNSTAAVTPNIPTASPPSPSARSAPAMNLFISPIRPSTTRKADDAATPNDRKNEKAVIEERRARRRASIREFNPDEWPSLQSASARSKKVALSQPTGSQKQLTIDPNDPTRTLRFRTPGGPSPALVPRGASSVPPRTAPSASRAPLPMAPPPAPPRRANQTSSLVATPASRTPFVPPGLAERPSHASNLARSPQLASQVAQQDNDVFSVKQEPMPGFIPTGANSYALEDFQTPVPTSQQDPDRLFAWASATANRISTQATQGDTSRSPARRSGAPSPGDPMDLDGAHGDDDVLEYADIPPAQPQYDPSEADFDDQCVSEATDPPVPDDEDISDEPAFAERTINIAWSANNDPIEGMEEDAHLQYIVAWQRTAWDSCDQNKLVFFCDYLEGKDPSSMSPVVAVKKLEKVFKALFPRSDPKVARAIFENTAPPHVRRNTFLLKGISDEELPALRRRRHYVIGQACITTLDYKLLASNFFGTLKDTTLSRDDAEHEFKQFLVNNEKFVDIFDKALNYKSPSDALRAAFLRSIKLVPLVSTENGENVVEYNVYAHASYLSIPLYRELRKLLRLVHIPDPFAGQGVMRAEEWRCTACGSRGHMKGKCSAENTPGWVTLASPSDRSSTQVPRGGAPTRGGRGGRGGRGRGNGAF